MNTPAASLLAAAWNWRAVPGGRAAFVQDSVVQFGVNPPAGLASFAEETKSPAAAKPVSIVVWNCREVAGLITPQLAVLHEAALPSAYGFPDV